jgi:hypothetical protein
MKAVGRDVSVLCVSKTSLVPAPLSHGILLDGNLDAASRYQALKDLDIRREDAAASIAMPKHLDQLDRSEKITNAK